MIDGVRGVGQILQDGANVLSSLVRADRLRELLGHQANAVGDLLDLVHDLSGRRLFDDNANLVAVAELGPVGRARSEDHQRLAEQRSGLLAERGVLVERHVAAHFHVELCLPVHEANRIERSDRNARDRDARPACQSRRIVDEGVHHVTTATARLGADESVNSVACGSRQDDEESNLGRLRALRHLLDGGYRTSELAP
jgi:hypothetical protein